LSAKNNQHRIQRKDKATAKLTLMKKVVTIKYQKKDELQHDISG
jgi:hypothetical protein